MGAYVMGIPDMDLGKLLYVAADSYKLARLFPMNHSDLTEMGPEAGLSFMDTEIWEVTGWWWGRAHYYVIGYSYFSYRHGS